MRTPDKRRQKSQPMAKFRGWRCGPSPKPTVAPESCHGEPEPAPLTPACPPSAAPWLRKLTANLAGKTQVLWPTRHSLPETRAVPVGSLLWPAHSSCRDKGFKTSLVITTSSWQTRSTGLLWPPSPSHTSMLWFPSSPPCHLSTGHHYPL